MYGKRKKSAEEWTALEDGEYSMCTVRLSLLPTNLVQRRLQTFCLKGNHN